MPRIHRVVDGFPLATGCLLLQLLSLAAPSGAGAELPPGWTVNTFTGRIRQIEAAGGVLACATDGGLLFFDLQGRVFAPPIADAGCTDGQCLTSNHLTCVSRDASGAYWLGTEASGAVVFRPGNAGRQFGRFFALNGTPGGSLLADSVSAIEAWKQETVYAGTSQGVAQIDLAGGVDSYDPDASRRLGTDFKGSVLHDLAVDSLYVWVATDSGVTRYGRQPPYPAEFLPDSLAGRETFVLEILAGTVYAGTSVGVFTWREASHSWNYVRNLNNPPTPTPQFTALSIARMASGRLVVGTKTGVQTFNGTLWGPLNPPPLNLLNDRHFDACVATGDTVWTCQQNDDGEGAYLDSWSLGYPTANHWQRYEPNAVPPSEVQAMSVAPSGDLWIGTRLAGVARRTTAGTWCIYNGNDSTVAANMSDIAGHVSMLLADRGGKVWFHALPQPTLTRPIDILTASTACNHRADTWSHIQPGELNTAGRYWRALEDGDGNRFFLSDGDQVPNGAIDVISETGSQVANLTSDILGSKAVGAMAISTPFGTWDRAYLGLNGQADGGLRLWIRSNQLFPPQLPTPVNFTPLTLTDTLCCVPPLTFTQYRDLAVTPGATNLIWAATEDGIFEYDVPARLVTTILRAKTDAKPGLLSRDVKDLQFDAFGNLWVATVRGLNRVRLAERQPGQRLTIDAFTTIETIRELNAASSVGQLYDPARALAPLPAEKVNALAYDTTRNILHIGTLAGVASLDVQGLSRQTVLPLSDVVLYPNPVRKDAGHNEVRIGRVSEPATVRIYTLEGELVCEVTDRSEGDVVWTLGTPSCLEAEGNFQAASGAYFVRITTSAGSTMRTLVVIR